MKPRSVGVVLGTGTGAATMERKVMIREARNYVSQNRWWFAGGGTAGILAIGAIVAYLLLRKR